MLKGRRDAGIRNPQDGRPHDWLWLTIRPAASVQLLRDHLEARIEHKVWNKSCRLCSFKCLCQVSCLKFRPLFTERIGKIKIRPGADRENILQSLHFVRHETIWSNETTSYHSKTEFCAFGNLSSTLILLKNLWNSFYGCLKKAWGPCNPYQSGFVFLCLVKNHTSKSDFSWFKVIEFHYSLSTKIYSIVLLVISDENLLQLRYFALETRGRLWSQRNTPSIGSSHVVVVVLVGGLSRAT